MVQRPAYSGKLINKKASLISYHKPLVYTLYGNNINIVK